MSVRRKYDAGLKVVCRLVAEGSQKPSEMTRDHEVFCSLMSRWTVGYTGGIGWMRNQEQKGRDGETRLLEEVSQRLKKGNELFEEASVFYASQQINIPH